MKSLFTSLCLAACTAAMTYAAPATAQPSAGSDGATQISRTVHLGDIDVNTQAGAKVAAQRIRNAADDVCNRAIPLGRADSDFYVCRDGAIDRALASLQAPLVAAALGHPTPIGLAAR